MALESRGRESRWEGREGGLGRHSHHGDGSEHRSFLLGDMGMWHRNARWCSFKKCFPDSGWQLWGLVGILCGITVGSTEGAALACAREGLGWVWRKTPSWEGLSGIGADSRSGIPIPGEIYNRCGCGTWGHGILVALEQFDSVILEAFSNPNSSITDIP